MKKTVLFIFCLALFFNLFGQWSGDPLKDIQINYSKPVYGWVGGQSIVSDGYEGAYMAWAEKNSSSNWNVFVQHVGATGFLEWNNISVFSGSFDQVRSYVISDDGACGGMIVAWQDRRSGHYNIYAQKYNWIGQALWTAGGVLVADVPNDSSQTDVSAISDGNGGAFLTWRDHSINGTKSDIYAQRLDDNGTQEWGTAGIAICTASGEQAGKAFSGILPAYGDPPFIISDNSGGAYIVWSDGRTTNAHVYGQRIDGAGTAYWISDGKQLESQTSIDKWGVFSVTGSTNNNFIFAYSDYNGGGATAPNSYVTKIDATGTPLWGANGTAIHGPGGGDAYPDVDSDGQGGALAVWWNNPAGGPFCVYANKLNASGVLQWGPGGINVSRSSGNNQYNHRPRIRHDGQGGAHLTWGQQQGDVNFFTPFPFDITANCIDANGVLEHPLLPNAFGQNQSGFNVMSSVEKFVTGDTCRSNYEIIKEGKHTIVKCYNAGYAQTSTNTWFTIQAFKQCQLIDPNNLDAYFYYSSLCFGDSTAFIDQSLGSPTSWNWNFDDPASGVDNTSTLENPKHKFSATGTYSVTLISSVGALKDTIVLNVCVGTGGGVINAGNDATICQGTGITLNASGGSNYLWSPSIGLSNPTIANPMANPVVTTTYTLSGTSICPTTDYVTITVNPQPVISLSPDITLCGGTNTLLTASVNGGTSPYSYNWNNGLFTATSYSVIPFSSVTYSVSVTDANGCYDTSTIKISITPLLTNSSNTTICFGSPATLSVSGANSYVWSPADALSSNTGSVVTANPTATITYTVTGDLNGCESYAMIKLMVYPEISVDAGNDTTINKGESLTLNGSGNGQPMWTPSTDLSCIDCKNPMASPKITTTYYFSITDANGCISQDSVTITVLYEETFFIPNAFTVNDDSKNDLFYVYGSNIKTINIKILDRWGQLIFESNDINQGWDGKYKNRYVQQDVYVCIIDCTWNSGKNEKSINRVTVIK